MARPGSTGRGWRKGDAAAACSPARRCRQRAKRRGLSDAEAFKSTPFEDGKTVTTEDVQAIVDWQQERRSDREIQYRPARVLMQDFTGVPCVVDLAAMRDAVSKLGGDAKAINPLAPVDLSADINRLTGDDQGERFGVGHGVIVKVPPDANSVGLVQPDDCVPHDRPHRAWCAYKTHPNAGTSTASCSTRRARRCPSPRATCSTRWT